MLIKQRMPEYWSTRDADGQMVNSLAQRTLPSKYQKKKGSVKLPEDLERNVDDPNSATLFPLGGPFISNSWTKVYSI